MIDTHQHFWNYSLEEYGWIDERMEPLQRDFLPPELQSILEELDFEGSIVVQARQTLAETEWLLELADQHRWIKGVVGWVDLCDPNVNQQLLKFTKHPKFVGVRHVIHDEPDERFLLKKEFLNGIEALHQYDIVYDLLIRPNHLPYACELVERFPNQRFVLDHLSKPMIREGIKEPWEEFIQKLAEHKQVACKISGMVTEADWHQWRYEDFVPYIDTVMNCFGSRRVMLGSDWPVCTLAGSYQDVINIPLKYCQSFSEDERADIESENAKRIYKLKDV